MRHRIERTIKRVVAAVFRLCVGSRRVSIPLPATFSRIVVVRQHNQLGDMLCAIPLLRALREAFPAARIVLVASPINYEIMMHSRFVDSVVNFDKRRFLGEGVRGVVNLLRFVRTLRAERFDLAIVPSTVSMSFTSDLLALLSGARFRIGVESLNGRPSLSAFCFNVPVTMDWTSASQRHQTLRNLDIARPLGISSEDLTLEITLSESEMSEANALRERKARRNAFYLVYHPGAGKRANRWPAERFARVANELGRDSRVMTFITVGPMDEEPVQEMLRHVHVAYELVRERSIRKVAVFLATADLVITNDTGIMHVAAGVGAPVLSLFGPTPPEQWAPIGASNRFLKGRASDISTIEVAEVLELARTMLAERSVHAR